MKPQRNPIDDKVRSARKRYGPTPALWGLLTALYAAGRDAEAHDLLIDHRGADKVLERGLALPDLGRAGEVLVGWAAHRYYLVERSGNEGELSVVRDLLPRAAYPVLEWVERTRPRPNLFDYSVEEAYDLAKKYAKTKNLGKPPRPGAIAYRFKDGWTVQDLFRRDMLVDEGNHQHNCVGQVQHGYPQRVEDEEIKIYSIRDPEGYPYATLTWSCDGQRLTEAWGRSNEYMAEDIIPRALEFGSHMGMTRLELLMAGLLKDARGIKANGVDLKFAELRDVDFTGADLRNAHLGGANLNDAKFIDANLEGASLEGANLRGADFTGAKIFGAHWRYSEYDKKTKWPDGRRPSSSMTRFFDEEP